MHNGLTLRNYAVLWLVLAHMTAFNVGGRPNLPSTRVGCSDAASYFGQGLMLIGSYPNLFKAMENKWKTLLPPEGWSQISPASDETLYTFGQYTRQIHRSLDGGESWTLMGEVNLGNLEGGDYLFPSPISGTLFLGAQDSPFTSGRRGIYKSTDGGDSWKKVLGDGNGTGIAFSPRFAEDGTAFASLTEYHASLGIWKTEDWGETWFPVNMGLHTGGCFEGHLWVAVSPQFDRDQTVFTSDCTGLYKSTNGGSSWFKVQSVELYMPIAFSPNYSYDQTLLIGDYYLGLFISYDGGKSMQQIGSDLVTAWGLRRQGPFSLSAPPMPPIESYVTYLPLVSRDTAALEFWMIRPKVMFGDCYLFRSRDYGTTWEEVPVFEATQWTYLPTLVR